MVVEGAAVVVETSSTHSHTRSPHLFLSLVVVHHLTDVPSVSWIDECCCCCWLLLELVVEVVVETVVRRWSVGLRLVFAFGCWKSGVRAIMASAGPDAGWLIRAA